MRRGSVGLCRPRALCRGLLGDWKLRLESGLELRLALWMWLWMVWEREARGGASPLTSCSESSIFPEWSQFVASGIAVSRPGECLAAVRGDRRSWQRASRRNSGQARHLRFIISATLSYSA